MTGSMSRYLAIPEQTPAMILLFGSRLSSFSYDLPPYALLYHNNLRSSISLRKHEVDDTQILEC